MLEKDIPVYNSFIDLKNPIVSNSPFCALIARAFFAMNAKGQIEIPQKEWDEKKKFYKQKLKKSQEELATITGTIKSLEKEIAGVQTEIANLKGDSSEDMGTQLAKPEIKALFDKLNQLSDKKAYHSNMESIYKAELNFTQSRYNHLVSKDKSMKVQLSNSRLMAILTSNIITNELAINAFNDDVIKLKELAEKDGIELWQALFKYIGRSEPYEELATTNQTIVSTSNSILHIYYNYLIEIAGKKEEDLDESLFIPPVIDWSNRESIDAYCAYWQHIYNKLEEYYKSAKELKGADKNILAEILKWMYVCILSPGSLIYTYNQSKELMHLDYNAFTFHYNQLIVPVANTLLGGVKIPETQTAKIDPENYPILLAYVLLLLNKSNHIIGVIELM